jgi:hypothetical protein
MDERDERDLAEALVEVLPPRMQPLVRTQELGGLGVERARRVAEAVRSAARSMSSELPCSVAEMPMSFVAMRRSLRHANGVAARRIHGARSVVAIIGSP